MLSVVICTYNEENNLPRVVKSVKDLADEIVVVDTQSTDNTVAAAKKLGCQVFHHKNTRIIEPVRNFAVSKTKGDWILLLDADEEVSPDLSAEIKQVLKKPQAVVYKINRQNIIFGKWIKSSHWWPDPVYRLYKKGSLVWQDAIHSLPQITGTHSTLKNPLLHHNYQSISQYLKKMDVYTDIQAKQWIDQGGSFDWTNVLKKPFAEFLSQLFVRNGLGDGLHGLVLAGLQAFSELVVGVKIWELSHFPTNSISLSEFQFQTQPLHKELKWWQTEYQIRNAGFLTGLLLKIKRKLS